jgi:hypothetical protein
MINGKYTKGRSMMTKYTGVHKLIFDKLKILIKERVEIKFGNNNVKSNNLSVETIIIFQQEEFRIDLCAGKKRIFIEYDSERFRLEEFLFDYFLDYQDIEVVRFAKDAESGYLFIFVLLEIILERLKQSKEYKIRSIYDKEFKEQFEKEIF